MIAVRAFQSHVFQTKFTDPQFGLFTIILWVGGEIPGINLIPPDLYFINVLDFCDLERLFGAQNLENVNDQVHVSNHNLIFILTFM